MTTSNNYPTPAVAWLAVTPYLRDWMENEFGGKIRLHGRRVLTIHYLPGVRDILRMETYEDQMQAEPMRGALSAIRMDCLQCGAQIGPLSLERLYGISKEQLQFYVPIECPRMAMTALGILRPWERNISFGQQQAAALLKLLRDKFWQEVSDFDRAITDANNGEPHTAISMTEAFCAKNGIPDLYAEELRREWQRQVKSKKCV